MLDLFCQLPQIYWFERNIQAKFEFEGIPASKHYQKLGKECQDLVGVPELNQVPITLYDNEYSRPRARKIEINEKLFSNYNPLTQKFLMLRRSAHKKFNDNTVTTLFTYFSGWSTYSLSYVTLKKFTKLTEFKTVSLSIAIGFCVSVCVGVYYIKLSQTRADKLAFKSLKCYKCVDEMNNNLHRPQHFPIDKYLSRGQITYISYRLKKQNLICENHH